MKIAVIGYSGSGKSTLADSLGKKYSVEVLHLDCVNFLPGWEVRPREEREEMVKKFLDSHSEWVIDGNYTKLWYERRMEEADRILFLNFNRISCFIRAYRRYRKYRGVARSSMAEGCKEKFDLEFAGWILWKSRTKAVRGKFRELAEKYPYKFTFIRNQRELDGFYEENSLCGNI